MQVLRLLSDQIHPDLHLLWDDQVANGEPSPGECQFVATYCTDLCLHGTIYLSCPLQLSCSRKSVQSSAAKEMFIMALSPCTTSIAGAYVIGMPMQKQRTVHLSWMYIRF